ncbi:Orexin receptor type 2 [Stylophora pistillata]|uniref:Orexin receptor type 2 n=1 Tax=Stylophora pistillata TaxID=50429 RepID=A0A2B4SDD5_STYPI|nr:Orexin receptor type 2 [Stylophora pistillata]
MSHGNITEFRGNNESDFDIACDDLNHTSSVIGKTVGFAFLFITSLMGNTMVAIVVYSGRRMKTTVNFMIVNMAVSDLLNTILVVPKSIMFIFTYPGAWFITGEIGDASCRIVHFLQDITVAVSLLSLLMIAIERFYAISCPVVANPIPDKKCVFMILSTWFVAFLMYITDLLSFRLAYVEEEGSICSHSWESLVADPVVFIPRVLTEIHTYDNSWLVGGTTGLVLCKVVYFVEDVTVVVSLLTLLMIAIERYNAISCQFLPDTIPRKRCAVTILSTWTLAFFMNTTSFFTFQISIEEEGPSCQHSWDRLVSNPNKAREIEFLVHTIIALMIPFVIVIAFYAVILIRIKRTPVPGEHTSIGQRRKRKRDRNVLYILLAVVLAFGLCWFPFIVYSYLATYIWMKVDSDMEIPCHMETFGEWALYLAYLNSSVNPVIYFTFCENYRNGFYKLIWPCLSTCNVKQPHEKGTHTYARSRVQVSWYRSGRGVPQNEGDNIHLQVQNQD